LSKTIPATNLETVLLKVPVPLPRQDPKLVHAYLRSLQQTVKSEDLLVVAQEGFEIRSKILRCAGLIAGGSFVSALLDLTSIRSQVNDEISYRAIMYLRCFDVNPTAVAEECEIYRSA
jgi:hypothetical protein